LIFEVTTENPGDPAAQKRWQTLWDVAPQRSFFSALSYVLAATDAYNLSCHMHLISRRGIDEAGALVCWRRRGPWREVVLPPFTQYSALLLRAPSSEADIHHNRSPLGALLDTLEQSYARVHLLTDIADMRPATWRAWTLKPLYTYRISPLSSRWSDATKRTFQRHKHSYVIQRDPGSIDAAVSLCRQSYRRHNRTLPGTPAQLHKLIQTLTEHRQASLFTATPSQQDTPTAAIVVLHDTRMAHYWVAGSVPGPSMTVLIGHVLAWLEKEGITSFDFVGANTPSIAEFKRRFGSRLTPYFHAQKLTRSELRLLTWLWGKQ